MFDEQTTAYHMNICNIGDKEYFANLLNTGWFSALLDATSNTHAKLAF